MRLGTLLVCALAASTLASCEALVGAGAGALISTQLGGARYTNTRVPKDVDGVWASVKETLEVMRDLNAEVELTEFPRTATTRIDGALVEVRVEAYDLDVTLLRIRARKFGVRSSERAESLMNKILDRLG